MTIIAISGKTKVPVISGLSQRDAAYMRRNFVQAEDNFDMLGNQICKYRIRK